MNIGEPLTSSNACSSTDKARADINRVGVSGLHVDGRERWIRAKSRLVVEGRLGAGTAARLISREGERPLALVRERRGSQLVSAREEELQRAVRVAARGRDVEAEDGRDVVGREEAVELGAEGLVRLARRYLGDVMRVLELALLEIGRAPGLLAAAPFVIDELALGDQLVRRGGHRTEQEGYKCRALHVGLVRRGAMRPRVDMLLLEILMI